MLITIKEHCCTTLSVTKEQKSTYTLWYKKKKEKKSSIQYRG
jgi:hypothetical protein